ncbi:MAG: S8 family serine peptidase [bacterium]|nr:S8 family serine peptidase [bacterium]
MRNIKIILLTVITLLSFTIISCSSYKGDPETVIPGKIIVQLKPEASIDPAGFGKKSGLKEETIQSLIEDFEVDSVEKLISNERIEKIISRQQKQIKVNKSRKNVAKTILEKRSSKMGRLLILSINAADKEQTLELAKELNENPLVEYAEPDRILPIQLSECEYTDPSYNASWHMEKIQAPRAQGITTGSPETVVAVIDSGIDYNHTDLAGNIWVNQDEIANNGIDDDNNGYVDDVRGYDFVNDDNDPMDDRSHGTHVAGIVAANGTVSGIAPNVSLMPIKLIDHYGSTSLSRAISSFDYATVNGADVINCSWHVSVNSQDEYLSLKSAIERAGNAGALVVIAAGNSVTDLDLSENLFAVLPAEYDCDNIITVAWTDIDDNLTDNGNSSGSNFGITSVDLGAPGEQICSTVLSNEYDCGTGTSMAAPLVSGAAALLKSRNPDLSYIDIKNILLNSVDKADGLTGKTVTGGRLNVYNALSLLPEASLAAWDFENSGSLPVNWENSTGDDLNWTIHSGSTSSSGTGPTGDATTGSGYYAYIESSSPAYPSKRADLVTPVIDLSATDYARLEFKYHMYGASMGELHIDVYNVNENEWHTDALTISGDKGTSWNTGSLLLPAYGDQVRIRFRGITGSGYQSDICIDDISIRKHQPLPYSESIENEENLPDGWENPAGDNFNWTIHSGSTPTSNTGPSGDHSSGSGLYAYLESSAEEAFYQKRADLLLPVVDKSSVENAELTFWYHMYGSSMGELHVDIYDMASYQWHNDAATISGDQGDSWKKQAVDLSSFGDLIKVRFRGITGTHEYSDISIDDISVMEKIPETAAPYTVDFENEGALPQGWENSTDDDINWTILFSSTPSSSTGPTGDHSSGSGYYAYIESSGSAYPLNKANLVTPRINKSSIENPELRFWYNMYGTSMGELHVDIYDINQAEWFESVCTISGDQGSPWREQAVDLSSYGDLVRIRFRGITGSNYWSDIAIDDVSVAEESGPIGPGSSITEITTLLAPDMAANDDFGGSVSMDGSTIIVGAWREDGIGDSVEGSGAAYIYTDNGSGSWNFLKKLNASDPGVNDYFGHSVSISGNTVIVGSEGADGPGDAINNSGAAYIYEKDPYGNWNELVLYASDAASGNTFGASVAIDNDYAIVGTDNVWGPAGKAYIFERAGNGAWSEKQVLQASDGAQLFGTRVAINGDYAVVTAYRYYVYVFKRNSSGLWVETAKLVIPSTGYSHDYRLSIAIDGEHIIVGDPNATWNSTNESGAAYIYKRNSSEGWDLTSSFGASDPEGSVKFGSSVSISGDYTIVGCPGFGISKGKAYLFQKGTNGVWVEEHQIQTAEMADPYWGNFFAESVFIDGMNMTVGTSGRSGNPGYNDLIGAGGAYVFKLILD